jgi:hypothetical protein
MYGSQSPGNAQDTTLMFVLGVAVGAAVPLFLFAVG